MVALGGAIFGIGSCRGWDAQSGFSHNVSATSSIRFLPEPDIDEPGVKGRHGADASSRWYYWKLPPDQVTWYSRLFVWVCYISHQLFVWIVIYNLQQEKAKRGMDYTPSLNKYNYYFFGINVFFHLLHLLQTHTTYDSTAQDVSIASSQCSVIIMLTFIMLMEYRNRGMVFGWPTLAHKDKVSNFLRLNYGPINILKRYHGYLCAWACVYTFWYHPMENTWGHVLGFAHTWILLLQGSLMMTQVHLNRYWRLLLETWFCLHAGVVAAQNSGPEQLGTKLWPMFVFGTLLLYTVTHIFSLPFWTKIHFAFRFAPVTVLLAVCIYMYSWIPDANGRPWVRMREIINIPAIYYVDVLLAWWLLYVFLKIEGWIMGRQEQKSPPMGVKFVYLLLAFCMYGIFTAISLGLQLYDVTMMLLLTSLILTAVLTVLASVKFMFLRRAFGEPPGVASPPNSYVPDVELKTVKPVV
ncbi:uncharacterized protein LOC135464744 isoform X2 [Liolophura sinensis]